MLTDRETDGLLDVVSVVYMLFYYADRLKKHNNAFGPYNNILSDVLLFRCESIYLVTSVLMICGQQH